MGNKKYIPTEDDYQASDRLRTTYQSAVGSLMYAMLGTRPDIVFTVLVVSRYGLNLTDTHLRAIKRIFRYLKATINLQLIFRGDL